MEYRTKYTQEHFLSNGVCEVTRQSLASGQVRTKLLTGVSKQQFDNWRQYRMPVQKAFPEVPPVYREFLQTGMTEREAQEYQETYGDEPDLGSEDDPEEGKQPEPNWGVGVDVFEMPPIRHVRPQFEDWANGAIAEVVQGRQEPEPYNTMQWLGHGGFGLEYRRMGDGTTAPRFRNVQVVNNPQGDYGHIEYRRRDDDTIIVRWGDVNGFARIAADRSRSLYFDENNNIRQMRPR